MKRHPLALLAFMLSIPGCTDMGTQLQMPLNSSINGKQLMYPASETFVLELDLNFDAGYQWDHTISDTAVVCLDSTHYRPKQAAPLVGGLAVETFYFRTKRRGTSTIMLIEHQGWMPEDAPINTVEFSVTVY